MAARKEECEELMIARSRLAELMVEREALTVEQKALMVKLMADRRKKANTVFKLLKATYGDSIKHIAIDDDTAIVSIQFNPDQLIVLDFVLFDTWDKIKSKVQKLIDSDGICVVCMEQEKGKKKMIKCACGCGERKVVPHFVSRTCSSCCEFVCESCRTKMNGNKCPVCRVCIDRYMHIYNREGCHCDDSDDDSDDDSP
jgi:hypothetical protein